MQKKQWIITGIILVGIVMIVGILKVYAGSKLTLMKVEKSIQALPLEVEVMDLNLTGIKYNEYPTQNQMLTRAERAIQPFVHTTECQKRCKEKHEENYELISDFKRLDKRIEVIGESYSYPYIFTLYNGKDEIYHLYYDVAISLQENREILRRLQRAIDQTEKAWGVEVKQTISIVGTIEGQVEEELQGQYAAQIFDDIGAYWNKKYKINKEEENIYYAYISHFKEFETNQEGNKYNVVLKFIFDPLTQQTQLHLDFPAKI